MIAKLTAVSILARNTLPRMGKTSTRPSILYRPMIEIFGTTAYTSYFDVVGSVLNPLKSHQRVQ